MTDSQSDKSLVKDVKDISPHCHAGNSPVKFKVIHLMNNNPPIPKTSGWRVGLLFICHLLSYIQKQGMKTQLYQSGVIARKELKKNTSQWFNSSGPFY